jgi:hypothetical protein
MTLSAGRALRSSQEPHERAYAKVFAYPFLLH